MKKYLFFGIAAAVILPGFIVYRMLSLYPSPPAQPIKPTHIRNITITAKKNEWRFDPETIETNQGEHIILTVVNEDDYDHGIGIDALGISQRVPANSTTKVEFIAARAGDFPFYCSVLCGEGSVHGVTRTHFDMTGTLRVNAPKR